MFKFLLTFFSAGPEDSNRLSEAPQLARETGVVCPPAAQPRAGRQLEQPEPLAKISKQS